MTDPIVKLNEGTGKVRIDQVSAPTANDMATNKQYTDDRDITAVSYTSNTLTFTRAAGNLTATIHSGSSTQSADLDITTNNVTVSSALIHGSTFAVFLNGVLMDKTAYNIQDGGGAITFSESLYDGDVVSFFDNAGDSAGVGATPTYLDLESPDGSRWRVTVTDIGSIIATKQT